MKLTSIHLQNYRAHQDLSVEFNGAFNVVAGVNGSGKTSLLRGISETLSGALQGTVAGGPLGDPDCAYISTSHIDGRYRFEPRFPVTATLEGHVSQGDFTLTVKKDNEVAHPAVLGESPVRKMISPGAGGDTGASAVTLPILAFYRANRQWVSKPSQVMTAATEKVSRLDGYQQWQDAATSVSALQHWVIAKCLERYQRSSETGQRFHEINDDELALVNAALCAAIEEIGALRYDMQQKSLLVEWHHGEGDIQKTVSFDNLSDGQRALICLVADIARRICLLNPHLGKNVVEQTPGVVLIDELDVHLHPRWQRRIVTGLKATFPAVQFIATSHSPQILGELHPEEIILLREHDTAQPQVSYGLDSSQVLDEIMGASSRNIEVESKLKQLFVDIENNQLGTARHLLGQLTEQAPQIPELSRAEALIRRKEMLGR